MAGGVHSRLVHDRAFTDVPDILLFLAAFATALTSAVLGLGGGVLLMLLMPGLLPPSAIVPVHAVVQSISNGARMAFAHRFIAWRLLPPLLLGSALGAVLGGQLVGLISLEWLPVVAGAVILVVTWLPLVGWLPMGRAGMVALGFYQTTLGMVAGATGPLGAAVLSRISGEREWLVVNTAVYMTVNHLVRGMAFGLLGFVYWPWLDTVLSMGVAGLLGTALGTRLRQGLPQRNFLPLFKIIVSLLAVRMMVYAIVELTG